MTYRGHPLARLLPILASDGEIVAEDPFYTLADSAAPGAEENKTVNNDSIDQTLYGSARPESDAMLEPSR